MAKKAVLSLLLGVLVLGGVAAQILEESREFFQDVSGCHAQGTAEGPDRSEALRLAKAAALRRLFSEMGKDSIFAQMCISEWPEYITEEDSVVAEAEGRFAAAVQVAVAASAMMLTEQKYRLAVADLLDRAEGALGETEQLLSGAGELERNLQVTEALTSYRLARARVQEARELVRSIGDASVLSELGSSVLTITAGLDAMEGRVAAGLERMQAIEREAQADAQADEMTRSLELYVGELGELEERGESLSSQSPFYDLPRTRLEAVLLDLTGDLEKTQRIIAELEGLLRGAPEDRALLRQKTELGLMDARALEQRLQRMEREVREEIRLPRLVRQERARRRHEALVVVASGLRYAFLHRPHDYVALQWTLPVAWDMESPPAGTQEADLRLVAQGVFSNGLWVQGGVAHEDTAHHGSAGSWKSGAWSSSFDLGVGRKTFVSLGVLWDWKRAVTDLGAAEPVAQEGERELCARIGVGGVDQEGRRLVWRLSLTYLIPLVPAGAFLPPYHLNARLDAMLTAGSLLLLEGTVASRAVQSAVLPEGGAFADAFSYRFEWRAGVGLRLPPPFTLLVHYGGSIVGDLGPVSLLGTDPHSSAWGLSLGYSF